MTSLTGPHAFGRVASDGTVYVRTEDGERSVGQIPDAPADEALAFYVRRFEALEVEVGLLENPGGVAAHSARTKPGTASNTVRSAGDFGQCCR